MAADLVDPLLLERILSPIAIFGGMAFAYAIRNGTSRRTALGLGGTVSLMGVIGLMHSFALGSGAIVGAMLVISSIALVVFAYFATDSPRTFLILPLFILLVAQAFVVRLSWLPYFLYAATVLALVSSLDISRIVVSETIRRADGHSGVFIMPFHAIKSVAGSLLGVHRLRAALFTCYLMFELAILIGAPYFVVIISRGFLELEPLMTISIGIFFFAEMRWRTTVRTSG